VLYPRAMIRTENLKLVPCELRHFEAILSDVAKLEHLLGVTTAEQWLDFPESIQAGRDQLQSHPEILGWWTYLFLHPADKALIGVGGFAGPPSETGMVEIGYNIAPAYRNRGLATEAAQGLIDHAFSQPQIKMVEAHTLSEINGSTRVLEKVGMKKIGTSHDDDVGEVWHWRLMRPE